MDGFKVYYAVVQISLVPLLRSSPSQTSRLKVNRSGEVRSTSTDYYQKELFSRLIR
jgi:ribosomal protein S10